jgi:hypothetical protein
MMRRRSIRWAGYLFCAAFGYAAVWGVYAMTRTADEVALTLGESYERVRAQSSSTLPAADPAGFWGGFVTRPAKFRFTADGYGFVTPPAKFLYVGVDESGKVESASLSPQIETLPLDKALPVVLELQDQLRRHGWHQIKVHRFPPITDTPAMVASIQRGDDPQTFWQADGKYQVGLDIRRFVHENRPKDERYLITLDLSGPPLMEEYPGD